MKKFLGIRDETSYLKVRKFTKSLVKMKEHKNEIAALFLLRKDFTLLYPSLVLYFTHFLTKVCIKIDKKYREYAGTEK